MMTAKRIKTRERPKNTDSNWLILSKGIQEIYKHNESQLSFEELYRNAYMMVIARDGLKLYDNFKVFITLHLESISIQPLPSSTQISMGDCEGFLKNMVDLWQDHSIAMSIIRDVMMYLDRTYLTTRNLPLTYDVGLELFRDVVITSSVYPVQKHLIDALLFLVNAEREQELIDRSLVKSVVSMLCALSSGSSTARQETLYESMLEQKLLEKTEYYYSQKSIELLEKNDCFGYLGCCELRLEEEKQRIVQLFLEKSLPKVTALVQQELLTKHALDIVDMPESGLVDMIANDQYQQMEFMYKILGLVTNGHPTMRSRIGKHIKELGKTVNEHLVEKNDFASWMEGMLNLKQKFDVILKECFKGDVSFEAEMNVAFQDIVSSNSKTAESIGLYVDAALKSIAKGKLEQDFDVVSDKVITVFRFLNEKDVFERYYKQYLAKRLLSKSINEDAEKTMLGKLKEECGYQFTTKMEGMFTDYRLSLDLSVDFKKVAKETGIDMSIHILTSTFWPFHSTEVECIIPPQLLKLTELFETFYMERHSGRVLTWMKQLGSADIKVAFDSGVKELNMSTLCMLVLLCFEENDELEFDRVKEMTCISEVELKRALLSLSLGKHKILLKSSKGKEIAGSDRFQFNKSFTSPLSKIKILTISSNSTQTMQDEERKVTMEKVVEDRKYQIEAAIVRVMKARKTLDHNNLVSEVIRQLSSRFAPVPLMVKQRIESLLERDYLERDAESRYQ